MRRERWGGSGGPPRPPARWYRVRWLAGSVERRAQVVGLRDHPLTLLRAERVHAGVVGVVHEVADRVVAREVLAGVAADRAAVGGRALGRVVAVESPPANDVLELDTGLLLPLVEACVLDVDLARSRIVVAPGFADAD